MKRRLIWHRARVISTVLLTVAVIIAFGVLIRNNGFDVLQPAGWIAGEQRNLLIIASLLSLIIVVPTFALTFYIVWNYRTTHSHPPKFDASFESSPRAEFVWWSVPLVLIAILGVIIWQSSHQLDPYKALASDKEPVHVQVIAMNWKWLFLYPEQGVASVNYLQIPVGRPINFELTSDAPMTSFWIPKLGGQVYAMSGMTTKLHLVADRPGTFTGRNANISGEGYSGMVFTARAGNEQEFTDWAANAKSNGSFNAKAYAELSKPSQDVAPKQYLLADKMLFDSVLMKYMAPTTTRMPAGNDEEMNRGQTEHSHE